jgi:hypothetical protein
MSKYKTISFLFKEGRLEEAEARNVPRIVNHDDTNSSTEIARSI